MARAPWISGESHELHVAFVAGRLLLAIVLVASRMDPGRHPEDRHAATGDRRPTESGDGGVSGQTWAPCTGFGQDDKPEELRLL